MYSYHNQKRGFSDEGFLEDKPLMPRDTRLEALKDVKVQKSAHVSDMSTSPTGWKAIDYEYENKGGGFLDEKYVYLIF